MAGDIVDRSIICVYSPRKCSNEMEFFDQMDYYDKCRNDLEFCINKAKGIVQPVDCIWAENESVYYSYSGSDIYNNFACNAALLVLIEMADTKGDTVNRNRWQSYAHRYKALVEVIPSIQSSSYMINMRILSI